MGFQLIWVLAVYCPVAHWMKNEHGWARLLGVKDFGGGINVYLTAAFTDLAK
jgi:Amt family ammonium transporter